MDHSNGMVELLEAKLALVTDRLQTVQRVAQLGFWDWNIETGDLYWSEEIYKIFDLNPDEFGATYDAFLASVHPDDRELVQKAVNAAVQENASYDIEHRVVQPDGTQLYVNEQGTVTRNEAGEPIRMLGTVINITERVLAEQSRQRREAEFQALWEAAYDGMITVTRENTISLVNKSTEQMFGYERSELIGQPIEILISESLRKAHIQYQRECHANPHMRQMGEGLELEGRCKDGEKFPLEISLTPIGRDGDKEILVEVQDISKRKALELRLSQAEKLEAVGQLTGGLAHDLNNMLAAMLGYTELAQMGIDENHQSAKDLEQVSTAGTRAQNMISQMLAFTRQQVLRPRLINLNDAIEDTLKTLKPLIPERIEIITSLDENLGRTHLDAEKLQQVIMNLALNARDAIADSGKLVIATQNVELDEDYIELHTLGAPGDYVKLTVTDSGIGMSAETSAKIFEPFFTTKAVGEGTGLGLSTVYGIVKQSKGDITVYSEPGIGTEFQVYFPITDARESVAEARVDELELAAGDETILLVEDDEPIRLLTKRILESNGYTVLDFDSGEAALAQIKSMQKIDLVITDFILPGMNGAELVDGLMSKFGELDVVYMSGYVGRALKFFSELPDDINYLPKPFTRRLLLQKVMRALQ